MIVSLTLTTSQRLTQTDYPARLYFCQQLLRKIYGHIDLANLILIPMLRSLEKCKVRGANRKCKSVARTH